MNQVSNILDEIVVRNAPMLYRNTEVQREAHAILLAADNPEWNPTGQIEIMNGEADDRSGYGNIAENPFIKGTPKLVERTAPDGSKYMMEVGGHGPDVFLGPYVTPKMRKLSKGPQYTEPERDVPWYLKKDYTMEDFNRRKAVEEARLQNKFDMSAPFYLKALRGTKKDPNYIPTAEDLGITYQNLLRTNAKMEKSEYTTFANGQNFYAPGLALSPHTLSHIKNLCQTASPGCAAACLNFSGQGDPGYEADATNAPQEFRKRASLLFLMDPDAFKVVLFRAMQYNVKKAEKMGVSLGMRLNVLSDWRWEAEGYVKNGESVDLFAEFPDVHFYDYTKNWTRASYFGQGIKWPENYHLTFSFSEINFIQTMAALKMGLGVAVPFDDSLGYSDQQEGWPGQDKMILPKTWFGYRVIDADRYDIRFMDRSFYGIPEKQGYVCGLRVKGNAQKKIKRDPYGFIQYSAMWAEMTPAKMAAHYAKMGEISGKRNAKAIKNGFFSKQPTLENYMDERKKLRR